MHTTKHNLGWIHGNISVGYILGSETAVDHKVCVALD